MGLPVGWYMKSSVRGQIALARGAKTGELRANGARGGFRV